jgi:hypothetical protein
LLSAAWPAIVSLMLKKLFHKPYRVEHSSLPNDDPKRFRSADKAKEFAKGLAVSLYKHARLECHWRNIPDVTENYYRYGDIQVIDEAGNIIATEAWIALKPDSKLSLR